MPQFKPIARIYTISDISGLHGQSRTVHRFLILLVTQSTSHLDTFVADLPISNYDHQLKSIITCYHQVRSSPTFHIQVKLCAKHMYKNTNAHSASPIYVLNKTKAINIINII